MDAFGGVVGKFKGSSAYWVDIQGRFYLDVFYSDEHRDSKGNKLIEMSGTFHAVDDTVDINVARGPIGTVKLFRCTGRRAEYLYDVSIVVDLKTMDVTGAIIKPPIERYITPRAWMVWGALNGNAE